MASIHLLVHFVISEQFDLGGGSDTILLNHLGHPDPQSNVNVRLLGTESL